MNRPSEIEDATLRAIALIVCQADLWESGSFTHERFVEFRKVISRCLEIVCQAPATCHWMLDPLNEILANVGRKHRSEMLFTDEWFKTLLKEGLCL